MFACRNDQRPDDQFFDMAEQFPGGRFDMRGVEGEPFASDIPHDFSLRLRSGSDGLAFERSAQTGSLPRFDSREFEYNGPTIKKQEAGPARYSQEKPEAAGTARPTRPTRFFSERKVQMLRAILTAALLCASTAAFSQALTAEQRSAC